MLTGHPVHTSSNNTFIAWLGWRLHHELAYPLPPELLRLVHEINASDMKRQGREPFAARPAYSIDFPGHVVALQPVRARAPTAQESRHP